MAEVTVSDLIVAWTIFFGLFMLTITSEKWTYWIEKHVFKRKYDWMEE